MHLLRVDLSHQILLTENFRKLNLEISEYTFANIYLFRQIHHYQLFYWNELFLKGITRSGESFLMPTSRFMDHMTQKEIHDHLNEVDFFYPIPEQWLDAFDPKIFHRTYDKNDSDYVFSHEKIQTFIGSHSNSKSNLVKQLLSSNSVEVLPLDQDQIPFALSILDDWQENQELDRTQTDYVACREAVELLNKLQLNGLIAYVDKEPAGFIIGERMAEENYVIHFVKGKKIIKGIYQHLFQQLADVLGENIKFINFEQDMGSSHLRQSKHSYHPDRMIHKWRISLK